MRRACYASGWNASDHLQRPTYILIMSTLVLGIGNLLLSDEGVGVHVVRALAQRELPSGVAVVEAGTAFLDVLSDIAQADRILLVDAMEGGGTPGTVYRVPFDQCRHPGMLASLHGLDLSRVLFMAGNDRKPLITVFGIEPARIEWGMELSSAVRCALPAVEEALYEELMRPSPEGADPCCATVAG
jgi:hydrogenase maturation protease